MKLSCARGSETHVRGSARKRLRKQMLIVRSRKGRGSRFIHDELVVAEAPRKQNQLTTHPRKLKLWSRKQRGRPCGSQVGLEENYIGVFATAQMFFYQRIAIGDPHGHGKPPMKSDILAARIPSRP